MSVPTAPCLRLSCRWRGSRRDAHLAHENLVHPQWRAEPCLLRPAFCRPAPQPCRRRLKAWPASRHDDSRYILGAVAFLNLHVVIAWTIMGAW